MISRIMLVLVAVIIAAANANASQSSDFISALPHRTPETDREAQSLYY
jgi:hypothetical protein